MHDRVTTYWWGNEVCLDNESTSQMLNVMDVAGTAGGVAALFGGGEEKIALGLGGAALKLGSSLIKAVNTHGGNNGVCMYQYWVGGICWVKPRPA